MEKFGIDVSEWQGSIDWETVKPQIDFAIVRLGYGRGNWDDEAKRNISELNRLGIHYGIFWFSYAYTREMAVNEARYCLSFMHECGAKPVYPVFFDWEYDSRDYALKRGKVVEDSLLRDMTIEFCNRISDAGHKAGVYANDDYVAHHYGKCWCKEHCLDLWYSYPGSSSDHGATMWQFGQQDISGIDGNVDVDVCYKDYEEEPEMKRFNKIEEAPGYSHGTLQYLLAHDMLAGRENGNLDLSEDMIRIFVVLDRAGKLRE